MRTLALALLLAACGAEPAPQQKMWEWDRALSVPDTAFMAGMTAGEIAAAQRAGARYVLLPIGGLEQNGPHVVTAKHDLIIEAVAARVAEARGDILIAETVHFSPQGDLNRPSPHQMAPGTLGVSEATYEALLTDICRSLAISGFERIFLIADSGPAQRGAATVAERLAGVEFIAAYYSEDPEGARAVAALGIEQAPYGAIHSDYRTEAMLAALDPNLIRHAARLEIGEASVRGASVADLETLRVHGETLLKARAALVSREIDRPTPQ